jgi:glycine/D-amino acid oxidase-like deaminating enzyme
MSTLNKPAVPASPEAAPSTAGGASAAADEAPAKRKKKYSKGALKYGQKAEVSLSKGAHRLARAVEESLSVWRERRDVSARKRRNGAVRDAVKNYGKAVTKFYKVAAKFPEEITKGLTKVRFFR